MRKFNSREELQLYVDEVGFDAVVKEFEALAVPTKNIKPPLYHLSFSDELAGKVLKPKPAKNLETKEKSPKEADNFLSEYCPVRLSVSDSVEGCYYALYSMLNNLWTHVYPDADVLEMYLYKVIPTSNTKILHNEDIVSNFMIHDAHITREHGVLGDFKLELVKQMRFKEQRDFDRRKGIHFKPYNDDKNELWFLSAPMLVDDN